MKMTRKILLIVSALLLLATAIVPVYAESDVPRLVDNAGLLTSYEASELLAELDEISVRQQADIVVVTVDSLDGKTPMEYADDFYDYNGYGFGATKDGVLLLISMENRDWWISTTGYGITALTDAGIEYISERFLAYLGDGDYAQAFATYARLCDEFFTQAKTGKPYDVGNMPREPFEILTNLIIALVVGLLVAFISTSSMKSKLKTVRLQYAAGNYIKSGSMKVTESRDMFLYTHIDKCVKTTSSDSDGGSSTHSSSSGTTHGGGGGTF